MILGSIIKIVSEHWDTPLAKVPFKAVLATTLLIISFYVGLIKIAIFMFGLVGNIL